MVADGQSLTNRGRACLGRGKTAILLAAWALSALLIAPTAQAGTKAQTGEFGTPPGHGNGQLENPNGVAVNRTGAGGAAVGDVYVADGGDPNFVGGNNRIVEFSATGAFVRAWGVDVVASGPDDKGSGAFEVCLPTDVCKAGTPSEAAGGMSKPEGIAIDQDTGVVYVVDANENSTINNRRVNVYSATGEFEGSFGWHVKLTGAEEKLQFCTTATGCQRGSSGGGPGQLSPVGSRGQAAVDPDSGHLYVPEGGSGGLGNFRVEEFAPSFNGSAEVTAVSFVKAIGWDVVAGGPDQADEIQLVRVGAGAGKFKLKYTGESTGELEYNASPEEVAVALNALPAIVNGSFAITVSGGPGDLTASAPYKITFHSTPKGENAAPLEASSVSLSGGSPTSISAETYNDGGKGLEVCEAAHPLDVCKAGVEGPKNTGSEKPKLGQFSEGNPKSVAVDGEGTLYAVNQADSFVHGPSRVLKFTFPGVGEVEAAEFAPKYLTQESGNPSAVSATDVAVDPSNDHVVVAKKEGVDAYKFLEFDSTGTKLFESPPGTGLPVSEGGGLTVGTGERFYFTDHSGGVVILGPPPPPGVKMKPVKVSEVGTTTATFEGTVTMALGPGGEHFPTGYHFEYSKNGISWKPFPGTDVAIGDGSDGGVSNECPTVEAAVCAVRQEAFGLEPNADYLVRIVADNGATAASNAEPFTTKPDAPGVSGTVATQITQTTAKLTGLVNPNNQPTTYHFEWGETTAYGNEVPAFEAFAGSGGEATKVLAPIGGLKEGTAYHFRVIATNPSGERVGPDQEFTTLNSYELPGGRAPEQVSPTDKRPVGMVGQLLEGQIRYQASSDGNGIVYPILNGLEDATAGGNVEYLGLRKESAWESMQLTPPSLVSPIGVGVGEDSTGKVMYASADLSCQLIQSPEPLGEVTAELEDSVEKGVRSLFRRNSDGTYTLLNPQPLNYEAHGNYHVDWASTNCSHILFDTDYRLLAAAPVSGRGLYEWASGTLRLAGILPDESVATGAVAGLGEISTNGLGHAGLGTSFTNVNSMSGDGSKVFFMAISNAGPDSGKEAIFMRKNGTETIDISQSHTGTVNKGARYAMATPAGSAVFFLANYGLATNGSSTGAAGCNSGGSSGGDGTGCDLYGYDTGSGALTDLSVDVNPADVKGASVVGLLDVSGDGSRVYFAARGQLVPNEGKTEAQNLAGNGTYNVYLSDEGVLSYVGPISGADANVDSRSGSDLSFKFGHWVADATPDGEHLLFISKANVTGYVSGGVAEVYLYSAEGGTTVCLSCRTDGKESEGNPKTAPLKQVTQEEFTHETDVQARPRSISDDGRHIFFTMPDFLVAGARVGTHNVYEWSRGQLYLLAAGEDGAKDFTEYEDSSPSGADVFLVTKAKLVPQDFDNTTDLYDLRSPHASGEKVGPAAVTPEPPPCEPLAGACQGSPPPQPGGAPAPSSEGFVGEDSPAAAAPKKPPHRRHKKHKGKHHKKHRHNQGRVRR